MGIKCTEREWDKQQPNILVHKVQRNVTETIFFSGFMMNATKHIKKTYLVI